MEKITRYIQEVEEAVIKDSEELEAFRIKFSGKKGVLNELFAELKNIPAEDRKAYGADINVLKNKIEQKLNLLKESLGNKTESTAEKKDFTRPVYYSELGSRHPLAIVQNQISEIFKSLGYIISEGPEIEDDWHNFSALNFPANHPARDMQDTFFVSKTPEFSLRTHTSSVQVRVMESEKPPIRTISPGRVYRNEAISARAHIQFHQVEGLYIDENVSFADLKQTLLYFAKVMFGEDSKIRLRPSYFPFTEPSAEMDVSCNICKGAGCNICKYTGWLEILGCGMVDPQVLENSKIDSNRYSGFAFGMGVERIAMLKYGIKDIRLFFENDVRFLRQFEKGN